MSDHRSTYVELSKAEQIALRHQEQWAGPFKEQAAKAEAALLVHRLTSAVNRVSSDQGQDEFPPFNGLAASILCAPPESDALSHGSGDDPAALESIGTHGLRALNTVAQSEFVSASENSALTAWQSSRHTLLQRTAPWSVITSPYIRLIGDTANPLAPEASKERLMPHSTAFSQTLYLALRHRIESIRTFVANHHPEWLDDEGEISPFSVLKSDEELSGDETLQRERIIAELAFLRDLKEQGILYLAHSKPGGAFYDFRGVEKHFSNVPKNGHEWDRATPEQALRWQRVQGRSPNLTSVCGQFDSKNATGKAQALCLMASYAGFPMEEGVYQDRSSGNQEDRSALLMNTRWASQERLILLEQVISHYQASGLSHDMRDYTKALSGQGLSDTDALKKATKEFEQPAIAGIEQSMAILEALADHHLRQPSIDIGEAYISLLDSSLTDPRTPVLSHLGVQRFGLSVDPSKINEAITTDIGSTLSRHRPWTLSRGYQPRTFEVMDKVINEQGYLGLNIHSDALFQKGANLYSKEKETEYMLRTLKQTIDQKNNHGEGQREKQFSGAIEEANGRIDSLREALAQMRKQLNLTNSRNEDLEHALAVSEDLYVATNIGALELMAEQDNIQLPPICQESKAAQWMASKGFEVPDHHRFIKGKGADTGKATVTLKEAFELTDQMEESNRQSLIDYFGDFEDQSRQIAGPTFI